MTQKLKIRDLTLRDGQQSLFATRLSQESVDALLPFYKDAGFYAMEVWGGAVPDSVMRYLGESPWKRLTTISEKIDGRSLLTALSRGRNLFGYAPYPTSVIEGFYKAAIKNGLNVMRIFDALNDLDNVSESVEIINKLGGIPDGAVCYTVDPKDESAKTKKIFTDDYFVEKAKGYEKLGAKIITLKDMAGLVNPLRAASLISKLKAAVKIPVDFHTHCTPGYGLASQLMAILNGVDILDTNIWYFGGGSAAPAIELVYLFAKKLGVEVEVNMEAVGKIRKELKGVRSGLSQFDLHKDSFPIDFDPLADKLPAEIDAHFDEAIAAAKAGDEVALLKATRAIEDYFNFPQPNQIVKDAEVPGGMYSNMVAQLKQLNAIDVLEDAMKLIPKVRRDAGLVPLVTPTSQIVGSQAVSLALDRRAGKPDYTNKSNQFIGLVRGEYGKTPVPIDPAFRKMITGDAEEHPYKVDYKHPENPVLEQYGGVKLAKDDEEYLLIELLPMVAKTFLEKKRAAEFAATPEGQKQHKEAEAAKDSTPITGPVIKAPMGGTVVVIKVKAGDTLKKGTPVLDYEAMKMQNSMNSDREGTVKRVLVKVGDVIATDQPLIELVDSAANAESNVSHLGIKALFAPANGIVVEVNAKRDEAVKKGAPLFTFEAEGKKTAVTAELDCTVKIIFVQVGRRISAGEPVVTIFQ